MLRYLDNAQNAGNRINENYARELMELHTLGVGGGYSQADVQAAGARAHGRRRAACSRWTRRRRAVRPALQRGVRAQRALRVQPGNRHDYGREDAARGAHSRQRGLAEVDEALDRLARAPATARFVSRKLAVYFVAGRSAAGADRAHEPQPSQRSDGDIAVTLKALFESPEFSASLGRKFRDPVHYVMAGVRLAYDERVC
jgi:uncharacterized protein (DUF1800 family)